jgi:hypothetical protein
LRGYQTAEPFAASLFFEIRKRMGETVFEDFHRAVIEAHEGKKTSTPDPVTEESMPSNASLEDVELEVTAPRGGVQDFSRRNASRKRPSGAQESRVHIRYPSRPIDFRRHGGGASHPLSHRLELTE